MIWNQFVSLSMHLSTKRSYWVLMCGLYVSATCYVLGPWDIHLNNSITDQMMYMLIDYFLFPSLSFWCAVLSSCELLASGAVCCCNKVLESEWWRKNMGKGRLRNYTWHPTAPSCCLVTWQSLCMVKRHACEEIKRNSLWRSLPWQLAHSFDKSLSQILKSSRSPHDRWPLEEPTS